MIPDLPSITGFTPHHFEENAETGSLALISDLIATLRPATFVALHPGPSIAYLAACQTVKAHATGTACHAIDPWPSGNETISRLNREHYGAFSRLMRGEPRVAHGQFPDGSIDLLLLPAADLAAWHPKLAPAGLLLIATPCPPELAGFHLRPLDLGLTLARRPPSGPVHPLVAQLFSDSAPILEKHYRDTAEHVRLRHRAARQERELAALRTGWRERIAGTFRHLARQRKRRTLLQSPPVASPAGAHATIHPPERQRIIDQFHRLFYHTGSRTWQATTYEGVQVLKSPFDLWVYQEIIHERRPDFIVETGTHTGGSALFFAHACDRAGTGQVITVDVATGYLRPAHPRITQLHGSSTAPEIFEEIRQRVSGDRVMIVLDSDHAEPHVAREIELYSPLVTPGDYLVVEDVNLNGHPVYDDFGPGPWEAVQKFLATAPPFAPDPDREKYQVTFHAWLRRTSV